MRKPMLSTFKSQLPLSVAILSIYGVMHLAIQQYIRQSANEIPVQYAMDTRDKLEKGIPPGQCIAGIDKTDMQKSLSPFVIIYDNHGVVKASSTSLNGSYPAPPPGVFEVAEQRHENRISWQPRPGVRNATVILPYTINSAEGYVLAGRSL